MANDQASGSKASKLKTSYKPFRSWEPIHTNGEAAISAGPRLLFSTLDQLTIISDLKTAKKLWTIDGDSSSVTSICCTSTCPTVQPTTFLLIAYRSLAIRIYSVEMNNDPDSALQVALLRTTARAHEAPISISTSDPTGRLFATGDTAGLVRVWDGRAGHCTHIFKGHGGIISALSFDIHLESNRARLAVGAGDCRIKLWDLTTKNLVGIFEGGHVSIIRGLGITRDGQRLVSGSRDKVLIVWNLSEADPSATRILKTIPIYESIESIGLIYPSEDQEAQQPSKKKSKKSSKAARSDSQLKIEQSPLIYTAGEKGLVRLWNLESGAQVDSEENHQDFPNKDLVHVAISDTRFDPVSNTLLVNKTDQTFSLFTLPSLELVQQVVGSHDEIIDMSLLRTDSAQDQPSHLALATNSPLVRILSLGENENDCRLLPGHSDIVLCLAKPKDQSWFVSGSKDRSARVWKCFSKVDPSNQKTGRKTTWKTIASCEGHVQSLGALSIAEFLDSKGKPTTLLATASQDRTVKLWDLSNTLSMAQDGEVQQGDSPAKLKSLLTMQIHDKDINSIDFSADCSLLGSGSQDKLGKLFSVEHSPKMGTSLKLSGILKGHSRGIWSIKFSKHDPYVITGSGDCTIKLWSTDRKLSKHSEAEDAVDGFGSCLKTFEGHSNSILRLDFINFGQQIVSASSDCLLKLWDIKTQVCVATLGDEEEEEEGLEAPMRKMKMISDSHEGKIWALDVVDEAGSQMLSAGADSRLICWQDVTGEIETKKIRMKEREAEINQDLENFVRVKDFGAVIRLLLKLDKPARLLRLFTDLERAEGEPGLDEFGPLDLERSVTGSLDIDRVIQNLTPTELVKLLRHIKSWNAVNRSSLVAQKLLFLIFKSNAATQLLSPQLSSDLDPDHQSDDLELLQNQHHKNIKKKKNGDNVAKLPSNHLLELKDTLKVLAAYSDRNLVKIDKTVQESFLIEFLLNQFN
ncbi:U3 small nucleolar RNA-associated protein 13 [Puccinia graminis f. sp. tritici]|uniref:U3 small nucleolar RNA-associated protein 13 n=1 Tax=Puccinia graminis f. sp. tritici TaxID=56615 RepID=A0A5B0Q455_PUCGR|nr:U3 small nucleolar RNA-associated protein 13 [Puccinia graminis f. sp. tritici]